MKPFSFLSNLVAFRDRPAPFQLIVLLILSYHLAVLLYAALAVVAL